VALMIEAAEVEGDRVLEIGTGSGYMTAVLARLARRVHTVDRWRTLVTDAEQRLRAVEVLNVTMMVGDGAAGWAQEGPFDRIVLTAGVPDVPDSLLGQLADGGSLVLPISCEGGEHALTLAAKTGSGVATSVIGCLRTTPLMRGVAEHL
jgi:protein-L-isoaspartate(D-aspartate) O-methyltransferase